MSCACSENLVAYLDGELSTADADAVHAHLDVCPQCREYAALLKLSCDALEYIEPVEVPAGFAARAKSRARRRALRPVYASTALAAAAAILLVVAVRFFIPVPVAPQIENGDIFNGGEVLAAGPGDLVALQMEMIENLEIPDDVDVLEGLDLYWGLDTLTDFEQAQIEAII